MNRRFKGVSLSIETIIIIVLCVLVLVLISIFVLNAFNPTGEQITSDAQLNAECSEWRRYGHDYNLFTEENYPGLVQKYKFAPIAESYCSNMVASQYVDCSTPEPQCEGEAEEGEEPPKVECCFGTKPEGWVCYCKGTSTQDCQNKDGCKWAPRG